MVPKQISCDIASLGATVEGGVQHEGIIFGPIHRVKKNVSLKSLEKIHVRPLGAGGAAEDTNSTPACVFFFLLLLFFFFLLVSSGTALLLRWVSKLSGFCFCVFVFCLLPQEQHSCLEVFFFFTPQSKHHSQGPDTFNLHQLHTGIKAYH